MRIHNVIARLRDGRLVTLYLGERAAGAQAAIDAIDRKEVAWFEAYRNGHLVTRRRFNLAPPAAPAEDTPAEDTPAEEPPVEDTPVEDAPAEEPPPAMLPPVAKPPRKRARRA